jgi:hypothetical protein
LRSSSSSSRPPTSPEINTEGAGEVAADLADLIFEVAASLLAAVALSLFILALEA